MNHAVAAVGTFDGLHRGHESVLNTLLQEARNLNLKPLVFTFDRHPLELIDSKRAPGALMTVEKKSNILQSKGIEAVTLSFDESLRSLTARQWMECLRKEYGVKSLVVGYDNTFGSDGLGMSLSDYRRLGEETGINVLEAPVVEGVSSSEIRKAVMAGEIEKANSMLGRNFRMEGSVVGGNHIGRTLGFPTANLQFDPKLVIPARGVYTAHAILPDGTRVPAMLNIGLRPTVEETTRPVIEAHLIGWEGDLYGQPLVLELHERLRDEKQFATLEELAQQLESDRLETLKRLNVF